MWRELTMPSATPVRTVADRCRKATFKAPESPVRGTVRIFATGISPRDGCENRRRRIAIRGCGARRRRRLSGWLQDLPTACSAVVLQGLVLGTSSDIFGGFAEHSG